MPTDEWLPTILHELPSGVLVAGAPAGDVVFWNDQVTRTWPVFLAFPGAADAVTSCRLQSLDGRALTAHNWPVARCMTAGEATAEVVRCRPPNGVDRYVDVQCTPVFDPSGHVRVVIAVFLDVTEQRRIEQALEASQARYENLYQDAPDMFASVTIDRQVIVQCNETLVRATGLSREDILGRPMRELHDRRCWPTLDATLDLVRRSGLVRDQELLLRGKAGAPLNVSLSVAAIRDEKDNLYYRSTWRDITERVEAQVVIQRKQKELEHSRLELQALAGRLLTAQEDERRRISRELHDDLNQRLAMLTLDVETLRNDLPQSPRVVVDRLGALRDGIVSLSDAVHTLAYQLHASILDDLGLSAALQSYLASFQQRELIDVRLTQTEAIDALPPDIASCLYRVAQEALLNVARHAEATRVAVNVEGSDAGITMTVTDNGVGFDIRSPVHSGSRLGIVGMHERVRLVNGRLRMQSRLGAGTSIDVWVPVPQEDNDAPTNSPRG